MAQVMLMTDIQETRARNSCEMRGTRQDVDVEKLWAQADASMPISSITRTLKIIKCNYQLNLTSVSGSLSFSLKIIYNILILPKFI